MTIVPTTIAAAERGRREALVANQRPEQKEAGNERGEFLEHHVPAQSQVAYQPGYDVLCNATPLVQHPILNAETCAYWTPYAQSDSHDQWRHEEPKGATERVVLARGSSSDPASHQGDRYGQHPSADGERCNSCPDVGGQHTATVAKTERRVLGVEAASLSEFGGVHVVVATERTVIARVRDDSGIYDVTKGSASGWSCSCSEAGACSHVLAVRQTTEAVTGL